jgi:hypothetical protein
MATEKSTDLLERGQDNPDTAPDNAQQPGPEGLVSKVDPAKEASNEQDPTRPDLGGRANTHEYTSFTTGDVPSTTPTFVDQPFKSTENNPVVSEHGMAENGDEITADGRLPVDAKDNTEDHVAVAPPALSNAQAPFEDSKFQENEEQSPAFEDQSQETVDQENADKKEQAANTEQPLTVGHWPNSNNPTETARAINAATDAYQDRISQSSALMDAAKKAQNNGESPAEISNQFPAALTQAPLPQTEVVEDASGTFAAEGQSAPADASQVASKLLTKLEQLEDNTRTLAVRLVSPVHHPKTGELVDYHIVPTATSPVRTDPVQI